jgi:L,D-transpeptidase ErfK/SrfK
MIGRVNMHASKPPRGGNKPIRSFGLMAITLGGALYTASLSADTYLLPAEGNTVIGAVGLVEAIHEDTLPDLAYVYDQGFQEMKLANPRVDTWIPRERAQK